MCCGVSPKLLVIIMFYNSFIMLCLCIWNVVDCESFVNGQGHHNVVNILYLT
jgi:hypothetical protein